MSQAIVTVGGVSLAKELAEGEFVDAINKYKITDHMDPNEKLLIEKLSDPKFQTKELQQFIKEQIDFVRQLK